VQYATHELPVSAGDLILAFTDGLFEAENANAEAFSITRLRGAIHSRKGLPLDQLMQEVFSEIKGFAEGQLFSDDVCFVGMEIKRIDANFMKRPVQTEKALGHALTASSSRASAHGSL
jgi:phosphoserine phosphatase RsbU/P